MCRAIRRETGERIGSPKELFDALGVDMRPVSECWFEPGNETTYWDACFCCSDPAPALDAHHVPYFLDDWDDWIIA